MGLGNIGTGPAPEIAAAMQVTAKEEVQEEAALQEATSEDVVKESQEEAAGLKALSLTGKEKGIDKTSIKPAVKTEKVKQAERLTIQDKDIESRAKKFSEKDPDLKGNDDILKKLARKVFDHPEIFSDKEKILEEIKSHFPIREGETENFVLENKVLKFLQEVMVDARDKAIDETQKNLCRVALNTIEDALADLEKSHGREIIAADHIDYVIDEKKLKELDTTRTKLRDLYHDVTGTHREPAELFLYLGDKFTEKQLSIAISFIFHAIGADLNSGGPSIEPARLQELTTELRKLQAGRSLMGFFKGRMRLVNFLYRQNNLKKPPLVNYEAITKQFVKLLTERYPNADKVLRLIEQLGIDKIIEKIIIISQERDAIPNTSVHHFFRSVQHRDEVTKAVLDALEQLEEELEALSDSKYLEEDVPDELLQSATPSSPQQEAKDLLEQETREKPTQDVTA
jgi:type III secretion protein W